MEETFRVRRHRIRIERRIESRNTVGEVIHEYQHTCETWAELRDNIVTIRYQPEIYPRDRVVIGNSRFEIVGVIDVKQPTRLVRLIVKETDTGRKRFCLPRQGDEQQQSRAFAAARSTQANRNMDP